MYECPKCGSAAKVTDSRKHDKTIWRRRRCSRRSCGLAWGTVEIPVDLYRAYSQAEKVVTAARVATLTAFEQLSALAERIKPEQ